MKTIIKTFAVPNGGVDVARNRYGQAKGQKTT